MNKTFLLTAVASYTEGSMLIVVSSIDEFKKLYKEYHEKKNLYLIQNNWHNLDNWSAKDKVESRFKNENNNKPFDFEIDTGTPYLIEGLLKGNHKSGEIDIYSDNDPIKLDRYNDPELHWCVIKEFNSDLPRGTHYYGDYCA